ncbi:maleylpyruvate isomerase family mycothiol-dependent enzyme [Actinoplanes palleronii]|uniref:Maleylpyruvate isomerase family mycothiol-dependent enzyme n=1 Tax=Actinoplanes palleronii TaxID=113570 RepID=A0ABQ4BL58_9ACTN|nr:maleylpyruvate isomerase family mycothiol-dependent enzyme [Actinoplanes palleronii]GIE71417.1 hypothetical protein Apa02nite_075250 [Actinoplanes palleronii]
MTDTASHQTIVPLIGAWALNACSAEEEALVEAHLDTCAACAREARLLRETAADLAGPPLRRPAGSLTRLLTAAHGRRPPAAVTPTYAAPYAAQVAALDLLLSDLGAGDWERIAAEEMSVRDLVAHLAATDGLVAAALGVPVQPPSEPGEKPADRTAAVLRLERGRPAEQTRRAWRDQADAVCRSLVRHPSTATVYLGLSLALADALAARAFETWIHGEDIAGALGRTYVLPLPEHLRPMADLAARVLPAVVSRRVAAPHDRFVRLRLTGDGGGTWTVPLDPAATAGTTVRPAAEITLGVVEFCRLAAARRDPELVGAEIRGDTALAREFLAAAPAMAPVP